MFNRIFSDETVYALYNEIWFKPHTLIVENTPMLEITFLDLLKPINPKRPECDEKIIVECPLIESFDTGLIYRETYDNYKFKGFDDLETIRFEVTKFKVVNHDNGSELLFENINGKTMQVNSHVR